ncbi:MAG TPA: thioesterase family protein [Thermoanaerobaculia bacterium]|nr:thioesterase family protein [Thermoanaerobaculia bacterium]
MHEIRVHRKVEYVDTDMSGIVHFSRFLIYMENAEHAFLDALGVGVEWREEDGRVISWPRVSVACDYLSPARFGDDLEIHLQVERKGTKSITYRLQVSRGGTLLARGKSTCACCVINDPEGVKAIPIPGWVAERIEVAGGVKLTLY